MFNDLKYAFAALRLRYTLMVLVLSFAATVALFLGLAHGAGWLIENSELTSAYWLKEGLSYIGGFAILVIGWFLFPVVMTLFAGFFLDGLARRLESAYYPDISQGEASDWGDATVFVAKSLGRALALNLLVLPFYFVPGVNLIAYGLVNAHLLAHEYFFGLSLRHLPLATAESLYNEARWPLFRTGLQLAFFFLIPGLNLLAPILATSLMLHRLERRPDGILRPALRHKLT